MYRQIERMAENPDIQQSFLADPNFNELFNMLTSCLPIEEKTRAVQTRLLGSTQLANETPLMVRPPLDETPPWSGTTMHTQWSNLYRDLGGNVHDADDSENATIQPYFSQPCVHHVEDFATNTSLRISRKSYVPCPDCGEYHTCPSKHREPSVGSPGSPPRPHESAPHPGYFYPFSADYMTSETPLSSSKESPISKFFFTVTVGLVGVLVMANMLRKRGDLHLASILTNLYALSPSPRYSMLTVLIDAICALRT